MKFGTNKKGYSDILLIKNKKGKSHSVHRYIAETFIPNPENKPQVNHKNGLKKDNRIENLEWCTNSENQLHAYRIGLQPSREGENNSNAKLSNIEVEDIKALYNIGLDIEEISSILGIYHTRIRAIIYGISWKSNSTIIEKRDGRSSKDQEDIKRAILTRFKNKAKCSNIIIDKVDKITGNITTYKSINDASKQTGIPRKSIEAVIHQKKIPFSNNKLKFTIMKEAGGFLWKKSDINQLESFL